MGPSFSRISKGVSSFSKPLIDLIQQGKTWTEKICLKDFISSAKTPTPLRITARSAGRSWGQSALVKREPEGVEVVRTEMLLNRKNLKRAGPKEFPISLIEA